MKLKYLSIAMIAFISLSLSSASTARSLDDLTNEAVSPNNDVAIAAINELRGMGPTGLDALFAKYAVEIVKFNSTGVADDNWKLVSNALDSVAMQKDAYASHLYWYTDLDAAKRVAAAKNRPILSLRLLGNLNEEFSCANSRLFRAVLYPNAEISKYLRENYILHWQSVRPAPRITIDFGDGRKIERTITGNSIHYILDREGNIIDALPGLYTPTAFLKYLTQGREIAQIVDRASKPDRERALMQYRKTNFDRIKQQRDKSIALARVALTETSVGLTAIRVAPVAVTKMVMTDEYSLLRVYDDFAKFEAKIDFSDWDKLAKLYSPAPKLDANSIAFIRRQNAGTALSEAEFTTLFAKLDSFMALDTTRNDFLYHAKLYQWLNDDRSGESLDRFNERVYADIFRTPTTDKWLGLYSTDVYTALDGNGITK